MILLDAKNVERSVYRDGSLSFVTTNEKLLNEARALFGRKNEPRLLVKIFHYPIYGKSIEDYLWDKCFGAKELDRVGGKLLDALKVQNWFSFIGKAPRVYGIFLVRSKVGTTHPAVLMENCGDGEPKDVNKKVYEEIQKICQENKIIPPYGDLGTKNNVAGGRWVDWQAARFTKEYEKELVKRFEEQTKFGNSYYQTIEELGADGIRKTETRLKDLGLEDLEFEGKTVIDVGCSGGAFLNYADSKGASYCLGLDWERVVDGAREVSNYLGHFNVDYQKASLHEDVSPIAKQKKPFDIVIYTSMITHTGVPSYLHNLGSFMVLEINHPHQVEETLQKLAPYWDISSIGMATDHGERSIYHCMNKRLTSSF